MLHDHHRRRKAVAIPLPKRLPNGMREQIEKAIDCHQEAMDGLVALLDALDGDADLEPSLGAQDGRYDCTDQAIWSHGGLCDLEDDIHDQPHDEEDEGTKEPSLAHTNDMNQEQARRHLMVQFGHSGNQSQDLEAEHDGREP